MHPELTAKVAGAGLGAAIATLIIWIIEVSAHINLEAPIEGAIATIAAFLTGLFVSDQTRGFIGRRQAKKEEAAPGEAEIEDVPDPD